MAVDHSYFGLGGKEVDFSLSYKYGLFRVRAGVYLSEAFLSDQGSLSLQSITMQ
jgi:hypothetical protein